MMRPKKEISGLLELDDCREVETQQFKRLIREHLKDTKEDREHISWMGRVHSCSKLSRCPPEKPFDADIPCDVTY